LASKALEPPAPDIMSKFQATITRNSWDLAYEHNLRMQKSLAAEIRKLIKARVAYAGTEGDIKSNFDQQGG
jgi:hypothetical protein